jgi:hypothetical protein
MRRKCSEDICIKGINFIMRGFMHFFLPHKVFGEQIKEDEMDGHVAGVGICEMLIKLFLNN